MRVAALLKQVPRFEHFELGPDGRLRREGVAHELNPFCRRALAQAVTAAKDTAGFCGVLTLGPPGARDVIREALACGADGGWLITDPQFAGSDTLATAKALAAALRATGPWDAIFVGRNSVDSDTGQVGPQVAELLGLPFLSAVVGVSVRGDKVVGTSEYDDGIEEFRAPLPAVISCAERLCAPAKTSPEQVAAVDEERVVTLSAADLGSGPWGLDASPTRVGRVRVVEQMRARSILTGTVEQQVAAVLKLIEAAGAPAEPEKGAAVAAAHRRKDTCGEVVVVGEPGQGALTAGARHRAVEVARELGGTCLTVLSTESPSGVAQDTLAAGADVLLHGSTAPEDVAEALASWCTEVTPSAVIGVSTSWSREMFARLAVRLDSGLIGDALELEVEQGRLVAWKAAFGGASVAAVTSDSKVQLVTLQPAGPPRGVRPPGGASLPELLAVTPRSRVRRKGVRRTDYLDALVGADFVVGVGTGVAPEDYEMLDPLLDVFRAELGATRRVADSGWLPRARQIGITGRSISPTVFLSLGASGKFNHMCGVRSADLVLAVNSDPQAPVFQYADAGLVGDWRVIVPALVAAKVNSRAA